MTKAQQHLSQRLMGGVMIPLDQPDLPWTRLELTLAPGTTWSGEAAESLRLQGRYGRLEMADTALLTLLSGVQYPDQLSPAIALDLHRMGLANIPAPLTEIMGGPFHVLAPDQEKDEKGNDLPCLLTLTDINGESQTFLIKASLDTLLRWVDGAGWQRHAVDWHAPSLRGSTLAGLRFSGGMHLGRRQMPLRRLRELRVGDALLIPSKDGFSTPPLRMILGSALVNFSQPDGDSYVFEGWVVEAPPLSNPSHVKAIEKVPNIMDALKVDLDFVVGRLSMTVAELAAVIPGRILPLELATPPRVRIVAHGTELGFGELIDVEGRLAVEITEWGTRP
ncbi:type III secretion system cytoplasmic ring protein SctQ [Roseateles sp. YR242]|uniref:type III secretion system cytoplasmic ring protein SctQ n=1 Tax=Roseateles sp. YR242 TaxID=1855305 RepID=UPI0015A69681|nr:type III secretion system cytoplasmic ring protein SctQ [Roseateles sp. YR242]